MTIEEIAIRQEIRQMLTEAGINRNTLKDMAKAVLEEEIAKACKQALAETNVQGRVDGFIAYNLQSAVRDAVAKELRDVVRSRVYNMSISVDISDENGNSSVLK